MVSSNFYMVQLAAAIGGLLLPALIALIVFLFLYLGKKRKYHLAEVIVEHGKELPEGFFEKSDMLSSVKMLKNGLLFLAVGIGTALLAWSQDNLNLLAISSVPVLVGIAYLIVSFVVKKKEDNAAETAPETAADLVKTDESAK